MNPTSQPARCPVAGEASLDKTPASHLAGVFSYAAPRPVTVVSYTTMLAGLAGLAASVWLVWTLGLTDAWAAWTTCLGTALPMWFAEARGRQRALPDQGSLQRPAWPTLALASLPWLLCLALFSWGYPAFPTWAWGASLAVLLPAWFWLHRRVTPEEDLGRINAFFRQPENTFPWSALRNILVKAFFLPLMLTFLSGWWHGLQAMDWQAPLAWFYAALALLYLVDVAFGAAGYLPSPRSTGVQIRSSNPYWDAWLAALICYPPFWLWMGNWLRYEDGLDWTYHLPDGLPQFFWGGAILAMIFFYAWATVAFGPRFSNLTYRGVVTAGPYRLLRHPAYVAKNISWWLVALPFIPALGAREAVFATACLLGINALYWARAMTEERHLLAYADYRRYYRYTVRHGLHSLWRHRARLSAKGSLAWYTRRYPLVLPAILFGLAFSLWQPAPTMQSTLLRTLDAHDIRAVSLVGSQDVDLSELQASFSDHLALIDPAQPYTFYSLTKPLTAYLVLSLHAQGQLSLHDPLQKWLPDLKLENANKSLTLAHLLSHRTAFVFQDGQEHPRLDARYGQPMGGCDEAIVRLQGTTTEAGTVMKYQNVNYCLLGKIVEHATGMPFLEALRTHFPELGRQAYEAARSNTACLAIHRLEAAGGYCYLPQTLAEALQQVVMAHGPQIAEPLGQKPFTYGYGFRVWRHGQQRLFTHYGYLHGRFSLFMATEQGRYLLLLAEGAPPSAETLFHAIYPVLARKLFEVAANDYEP